MKYGTRPMDTAFSRKEDDVDIANLKAPKIWSKFTDIKLEA